MEAPNHSSHVVSKFGFRERAQEVITCAKDLNDGLTQLDGKISALVRVVIDSGKDIGANHTKFADLGLNKLNKHGDKKELVKNLEAFLKKEEGSNTSILNFWMQSSLNTTQIEKIKRSIVEIKIKLNDLDSKIKTIIQDFYRFSLCVEAFNSEELKMFMSCVKDVHEFDKLENQKECIQKIHRFSESLLKKETVEVKVGETAKILILDKTNMENDRYLNALLHFNLNGAANLTMLETDPQIFGLYCQDKNENVEWDRFAAKDFLTLFGLALFAHETTDFELCAKCDKQLAKLLPEVEINKSVLAILKDPFCEKNLPYLFAAVMKEFKECCLNPKNGRGNDVLAFINEIKQIPQFLCGTLIKKEDWEQMELYFNSQVESSPFISIVNPRLIEFLTLITQNFKSLNENKNLEERQLFCLRANRQTFFQAFYFSENDDSSKETFEEFVNLHVAQFVKNLESKIAKEMGALLNHEQKERVDFFLSVPELEPNLRSFLTLLAVSNFPLQECLNVWKSLRNIYFKKVEVRQRVGTLNICKTSYLKFQDGVVIDSEGYNLDSCFRQLTIYVGRYRLFLMEDSLYFAKILDQVVANIKKEPGFDELKFSLDNETAEKRHFAVMGFVFFHGVMNVEELKIKLEKNPDFLRNFFV